MMIPILERRRLFVRGVRTWVVTVVAMLGAGVLLDRMWRPWDEARQEEEAARRSAIDRRAHI